MKRKVFEELIAKVLRIRKQRIYSNTKFIQETGGVPGVCEELRSRGFMDDVTESDETFAYSSQNGDARYGTRIVYCCPVYGYDDDEGNQIYVSPTSVFSVLVYDGSPASFGSTDFIIPELKVSLELVDVNEYL